MRPVIALLVAAAMLLPAAGAQTLHEDYERASDDYTLLRIMAGLALDGTTEALNRSLDLEHEEGLTGAQHVEGIAEAMLDAVRANASAATSTSRLQPLAAPALSLSENLTPMLQGWERVKALESRASLSQAERAQGQLHLGSVRANAHAMLDAADAYDALEYETRWLREALQRFLDALDLVVLPDAPPDATPFLYLEASPNEVPLTRALHLRGVLVAGGDVGGIPVRLDLGGSAWGDARTDASGYFALKREVPAAYPVGTTLATATAAQGQRTFTSDDVVVNVTRFPTHLALTTSRDPWPPNDTHALFVRLLDDDGRPMEAEVTLRVAELAPQRVVTDARGLATIVVNASAVGLGTHRAVATYAGSGFYAPAEATLSWTVGGEANAATRDEQPTPPDETGGGLVRAFFGFIGGILGAIGAFFDGLGLGAIGDFFRFLAALLEALGELIARALDALLADPVWLVALRWLVILAAVGAHAFALERTASRSRLLFRALLVLGPLAGGLLVLAVTATMAAAVVTAIASGFVSIAMWRRHRVAITPPAATSPAPLPSDPTEHGPAAQAPPASSAQPEPAAAEAPAVDLKADAVGIYRALLGRLADEGLDVRPLTHREIAVALRARAGAEDTVRELTQSVERILYARAEVGVADVARLRSLAHRLGVSA